MTDAEMMEKILAQELRQLYLHKHTCEALEMMYEAIRKIEMRLQALEDPYAPLGPEIN